MAGLLPQISQQGIEMGKGIGWIIAGFIVGVIGALTVVGWPLMIIGTAMIVWGIFRFFFGAAAGAAKVGAAGIKAASTKEVRK